MMRTCALRVAPGFEPVQRVFEGLHKKGTVSGVVVCAFADFQIGWGMGFGFTAFLNGELLGPPNAGFNDPQGKPPTFFLTKTLPVLLSLIRLPPPPPPPFPKHRKLNPHSACGVLH